MEAHVMEGGGCVAVTRRRVHRDDSVPCRLTRQTESHRCAIGQPTVVRRNPDGRNTEVWNTGRANIGRLRRSSPSWPALSGPSVPARAAIGRPDNKPSQDDDDSWPIAPGFVSFTAAGRAITPSGRATTATTRAITAIGRTTTATGCRVGHSPPRPRRHLQAADHRA
jgi:hypothetical protein